MAKLTVAQLSARIDSIESASATIPELRDNVAKLIDTVNKQREVILKLRDELLRQHTQINGKPAPAPAQAQNPPKPTQQSTKANGSRRPQPTRNAQPNGKVLTSLEQYATYRDAVKARVMETSTSQPVLTYAQAKFKPLPELLKSVQ